MIKNIKIFVTLIVNKINNEHIKNEIKSVLTDYFTYFAGLILVGFINFFTIPAIVKLYGVDAYGEFSLIQNIILITISFASGWLNQCIIRFNNHKLSFVATIYYLLVLAFIPAALFLLVYHLYIGYNSIFLLLSIVTLLFGSFYSLGVSFFQSEFQSKKSVLTDLIRVLTFVFTILLFYYLSIQNAIFMSFFISYLIPSIYIYIINRRKYYKIIKFIKTPIDLSIKSNAINKFLNYGIPLTMWFVASSLIGVFSRYVIDFYMTKSDVGYYSAIYDMTNKGCQLLFAPFLIAGFPLLSKLHNEGNHKKASLVIRNLIILEIIIFLIASIFLFYLSEFYLTNIIGLRIFSYSKKLVFLIFFSSFIWQIAMITHKQLELNLKTKRMLLFISFSLLTNIILATILIPIYGIIAGGVSTLISGLLYLILSLQKLKYLKHLIT